MPQFLLASYGCVCKGFTLGTGVRQPRWELWMDRSHPWGTEQEHLMTYLHEIKKEEDATCVSQTCTVPSTTRDRMSREAGYVLIHGSHRGNRSILRGRTCLRAQPGKETDPSLMVQRIKIRSIINNPPLLWEDEYTLLPLYWEVNIQGVFV